MGLNLEDILASLDSEKTAEEEFEKSLSASEVESKSEQVGEKQAAEAETEEIKGEAKEAENTSTETETDTEEEVKLAEDLEEQGRIMARGFVDELNKLAGSEEDSSAEGEQEKQASFADQAVDVLVKKYIR